MPFFVTDSRMSVSNEASEGVTVPVSGISSRDRFSPAFAIEMNVETVNINAAHRVKFII